MKSLLFSTIAIGVMILPFSSVGASQETDKENWRVLDTENTLYIDTARGRIIVELSPEFAPQHVERIKKLTKEKFYDYLTFHRVIDGFMAQGGDPTGTGTGASKEKNIPGEFSIRRSPGEMKFTLVDQQDLNPRDPEAGKVQTGFYKGFVVGTQPDAQALATKDKKVESWMMHCPGVASMARSQDPDSANSQFFLMRGNSSWLDKQYSAWGRVVLGQEYVDAIKEGTVGETEGFKPDYIKQFRLASEVPKEEQKTIEIMRTDTQAFKDRVEKIRQEKGEDFNVCDVSIPARILDKK